MVMAANSEQEGPAAANRQFATTRWSVVLAAGDRGSAGATAALEVLCGTYWFPLYAYARRRVTGIDEAQDLTQAFFARLLEKNDLAAADPGRGKFRAYLLTAFRHFLSNEWNRARARKRGGGQLPISLDFESGEERIQLEPADTLTPEQLFERKWILTLLERVFSQLADEYRRIKKTDQFNAFKPFITGSGDAGDYGELADELGLTVGATKVAVHRLRRRYRKLLRAEIAETVDNPDHVDDEINQLFSAF